MNRRKFAWLALALLLAAIIWRTSDLKGIYERIGLAKSERSDHVDQNLSFLQKRLEAQRRRAANLEKLALWQSEEDLISWLTKQADSSGVKIVGVERLPTKEESEYHHMPVKITVTGYYNSMGVFVNELEQSSSKIKIDSFSIRRKEHGSEYATLDLSLSYFQKVDNPS